MQMCFKMKKKFMIELQILMLKVEDEKKLKNEKKNLRPNPSQHDKFMTWIVRLKHSHRKKNKETKYLINLQSKAEIQKKIGVKKD